MTKCRLCQHDNPDSAERCEECGTWLSQDVDPTPAEDAATVASQSTDTKSPPATSEFDSQILQLLSSGQKIAAIKLYRENKGTDLKTAKEAVEALAERHAIPRGSGCAGAILFLLLAGFVLFSLT